MEKIGEAGASEEVHGGENERANELKTRRYPDFEYDRRKGFADRVHQSFKDKAGKVRKGIVELGIELKRMEDDFNEQLKAMIENRDIF
ncbi:hypothetical protein BOTNAR_0589g00020 [Botryotinia narcissicola]|uniref:Uncharacterized protein n=1 Tax=Botryotinia narcissicola TaxID=278944 RepID=A0A4Z1HBF9_9HELO|nr:hypothetical protein BOTNAR_0589g00020 [Botryotinia narcissicola]